VQRNLEYWKNSQVGKPFPEYNSFSCYLSVAETRVEEYGNASVTGDIDSMTPPAGEPDDCKIALS
jgi:hypothetical protein